MFKSEDEKKGRGEEDKLERKAVTKRKEDCVDKISYTSKTDENRSETKGYNTEKIIKVVVPKCTELLDIRSTLIEHKNHQM